ncbi:LysR family transcriptional regulator [Streptomyces sp. NPDC060194]|uniref:LysR family transcriptional regulator n=1 Tax=Streptomyces sp. NPDC060194 TaxID=3347069 RepID=UPI0036622E3D
MELRQLEYLVAVAEEGGFTRAAERLHVAQPGISAQIRKLERELGEELLDRGGRTVVPTEAGAAVLPYARAALAAVQGARAAVEELTGLVRGQVRIGTITSLGPTVDLTGLLAAFHKAHPAVEIGLVEDTSDRLVEAVRAGRLDLAVVSVPDEAEPPRGVAWRVVSRERLVAAVRHGHPLAVGGTVPLAGLVGHPLMCLPHGTGLRTVLERAVAAAGLDVRVAFEAGDPGTLARLAVEGLGVAVVPESLARWHADTLHTCVLVEPVLHGRLALAWRAEGPVSPAAHALARAARTRVPPAP